MSDIVERLHDHATGYYTGMTNNSSLCAEAADEIERLRKPLEQIRQVCADNAGEASNHKIALDFVHQIAIRALKEQK